MGREINLLDRYPKSKRPIEERGQLITEEHRAVARQFGHQYYDGERLFGYGGYSYHPRFWQPTVARFKEFYGLVANANLLDVGCAKGFMLHDFKELMPELDVHGIDISQYGIDHALEDMKPVISRGNATELPYEDSTYDLVISINTVHNLAIDDCRRALAEIQRVTRADAFITVDAWRTDVEREQLLKWNLTALTYMHVDEWKELFTEIGYEGDYYWFIAE